MKKDKSCKTRKGESTIGKIIYGFLLFAPLIAMLTTCMYVIFNKNAKDSYTGNTQYKETINARIPLEQNTYYYSKLPFTYYQNWLPKIANLQQLTYEKANTTYKFNSAEYNYNYFAFTTENTGATIKFYGSNEIATDINDISMYTLIKSISGQRSNENALFTFTTTNDTIQSNIDRATLITQMWIDKYEIDNNLSNVFYASAEKVEKAPIFNWTKNTLLYAGVEATANTLGITNTFIPMLLAYWLIISILYFIYDIVLMIILILHDKIHELQESI